jgi:hypothetical protein
VHIAKRFGMQALLAVTHTSFHQQDAHHVLHLHYLPDQQNALAQGAQLLANRFHGHRVLRQAIAPQTFTNLAGVDAVDLIFAETMARNISGRTTFSAPASGLR